jgi:hypothetical protein
MTLARRAWNGSLAAALVVALWGCGEDKPATESSTAEAKVTGKVMIRGKPMTSGELIFNPANYLRQNATARKAKINPDGTFEVTTLVGQNSVMISGPAITKEPQLGYGAQTIDVKEGDNTLNIELPPPTPGGGEPAKK